MTLKNCEVWTDGRDAPDIKDITEEEARRYVLNRHEAEPFLYIENIDTGDQFAWNKHTSTWDEL